MRIAIWKPYGKQTQLCVDNVKFSFGHIPTLELELKFGTAILLTARILGKAHLYCCLARRYALTWAAVCLLTLKCN